MGTIYVKNGIKYCLYSRDHNPPHIHMLYAEYEVVLEIISGRKLKGKMPRKQMKEIQQWLEDSKRKKKLVKMFNELNPSLRKK